MSYLNAYVPSSNSSSRSVKTSWAGLNRKNTQDSGELSDILNISTEHLPWLRTAKGYTVLYTPPDGVKVLSVHPVGEHDYLVLGDKDGKLYFSVYENGIWREGATIGNEAAAMQSVVPFNVYSGDNIVTSGFSRKILIFPACYSIDLEQTLLAPFNTADNPVPKLKHAVAMNGRVFGVLKGKFYASEWNNYAGWNLNTAEETDTALAWVSTTQSDTDASGDFTGIACYDGHVIGFKRNFMHQIYNNKAPFRIVDIAKVGALSQEAICECNQILFFVGADGVYAYTGGYPTRISDKLNVEDFEGAVLGADDRTLYCYLPSSFTTYTYDTVNGTWGDLRDVLLSYAANVDGRCLAVVDNSVVALCDVETSNRFYFASDVTMNGSLLEKRIKRIRLQVVCKEQTSQTGLQLTLRGSDSRELATKVFMNPEVGSHVFSLVTRTTCDFGHRLEVAGFGNFEFRYLQIDYEDGGERYDG